MGEKAGGDGVDGGADAAGGEGHEPSVEGDTGVEEAATLAGEGEDETHGGVEEDGIEDERAQVSGVAAAVGDEADEKEGGEEDKAVNGDKVED